MTAYNVFTEDEMNAILNEEQPEVNQPKNEPIQVFSKEEVDFLLDDRNQTPVQQVAQGVEQKERANKNQRQRVEQEDALINFMDKYKPEIDTALQFTKDLAGNTLAGAAGIPRVIQETPGFLIDLATDPENTIRGTFGLEPKPSLSQQIYGTENEELVREELSNLDDGGLLHLLETIKKNTPDKESIKNFFGKSLLGPAGFAYETFTGEEVPTSEEAAQKLGVRTDTGNPIVDTLLASVRGGIEGAPFGAEGAALFALQKGVDKGLESLDVSPEARQKVSGSIGLLPFALGGAKALSKKRPNIDTKQAAYEVLKTDKLAQKNLRPKLDVLDAWEQVGNLEDVPVYLISDTALLEDSAMNLKKSPLSKRRFNDQMKTVSDGLETKYQKTLDEVGENRFSSEMELQDRLDQLNSEKKYGTESNVSKLEAEVQKAQDAVNAIDLSYENPVKNMGAYISETPRRVRKILGDETKALLDENVRTARKTNREAYEYAEEVQPNQEMVPTQLAEYVQEQIDRLEFEGALSQSSAASLRQLKQLQELIGTPDAVKAVRVGDLIKQKVNFNDILIYETVGTPRELVKGVNGKVNDSIYAFKVEYPEWGERFEFAEETYAQNDKTFGNDAVTKVRKDKPEQLFRVYKDPSQFNLISDALIGEGGYDLIQEMKRERLIDAVGIENFEAEGKPNITPKMQEELFQIQEVFSQDENDFMHITKNLNDKLDVKRLSNETILKSIQDSLIETEKDSKMNPLVANLAKTEEGIMRLRDALNGTEQGRRLMKSIERYSVERLFNDSIFDNNGNIDTAKFQNAMKNKDNIALLRRIGGDKLVKNMKAMSKAIDSMDKFIKSNPKTSSIPFAFAMAQFISGSPFKAMRTLGIKQGAQVLFSKFLNEPDSIRMVTKFASEKSPKTKMEIMQDLNTSFERFVKANVSQKQKENDKLNK